MTESISRYMSIYCDTTTLSWMHKHTHTHTHTHTQSPTQISRAIEGEVLIEQCHFGQFGQEGRVWTHLWPAQLAGKSCSPCKVKGKCMDTVFRNHICKCSLMPTISYNTYRLWWNCWLWTAVEVTMAKWHTSPVVVSILSLSLDYMTYHKPLIAHSLLTHKRKWELVGHWTKYL